MISDTVFSLLCVCRCGGMVDAVDSKSTLGNQVLVRVRPSASFAAVAFEKSGLKIMIPDTMLCHI